MEKILQSFEQKFANWDSKLADVSRRNRMLYYQPLKLGTVDIEGDLQKNYKKVTKSKLGLEFATRVVQELNEEDASYQKRWNVVKGNTRKLERIRNVVKNANDEMGFNIGYATFGFLRWEEDQNKAVLIETPLLLVPIEIERPSIFAEIKVKFNNDEEIVVNPTLVKVLKEQYNIDLPLIDASEELSTIFDNINEVITKHGWSIIERASIDTFNFQNLVIQKDLIKNKKLFVKNPFIKTLLGEKDLTTKWIEEYNVELDLKNQSAHANMQILDADSSQQEAIMRARRGDSFVLQGPPGTGKSQTITNIIGEQIGLGKKVLFVSEKQAAIDVVYNKLVEHGLDDFCLTLHSSKQKKTSIRNQLKNSLDLAINASNQVSENINLYENLARLTNELNHYNAIVHNNDLVSNMSFYEIHGKLVSLLDAEDLPFYIDKTIYNLKKDELDLLFNKITYLADSYPELTTDFSNSVWHYYQGSLSMMKTSELNNLVDSFKNSYPKFLKAKASVDLDFPNQLAPENLVEFVKKITHLSEEREGHVDPNWFDLDAKDVLEKFSLIAKSYKMLQTLNDEASVIKEEIKATFEEEFLSTINPDKTLKIVKFGYASKLKRNFSNEYKQIFKDNKVLTHDFNLTHELLIENLTKLVAYNAKRTEINNFLDTLIKLEQALAKKMDINWDFFRKNFAEIQLGYEWLCDVKNTCINKYRQLVVERKFIVDILNDEPDDLEHILEITNKFAILEEELKLIQSELAESFPSLDDKDFEVTNNLVKLVNFDELIPFTNHLKVKNELISEYSLGNFIDQLENTPIVSSEVLAIFKKRVYLLMLENTHEYSQISNITATELTKKISEFKLTDKKTFNLAKERILNNLINNIPNINATEHEIHEEMLILKKEIAKKTRLLSTRQLVEKLPNLLPKIKPCIMMSPLTVSTYFASNPNWEFDVVIFDEASQVKPEYAIPAIARGKQIIIAGDSRQLPPTRFFNASDNDNFIPEEYVELDSILDEFSIKLPEVYLNWHYRSKDESLITFSNKKFYNGRLATFPTNTSTKNSNVKFNYVESGVWEPRYGNAIEADIVVEQIKHLALLAPHKSVGVVTFGISQATLIEDKLIDMRENNPDLEPFFDERKKEPFFIKNLENVQGDERDIIILSVGYGRQANGILKMNFGPLTMQGGERRLNVAASRARETMHVISSIKASDIRINNHNENRQTFRDFLEYAEKGPKSLLRFNHLDNQNESEFDSEFEADVFNFLTTKGFKLNKQIGTSGYKIDMALVHPKFPEKFALAIECDGATYHSSKTARDRDRLRQEILESKGWNFYRVWSTTWIHDNANEKKRLLDHIDLVLTN